MNRGTLRAHPLLADITALAVIALGQGWPVWRFRRAAARLRCLWSRGGSRSGTGRANG